MRRTTVLFVVVAALVGCNAILDNTPGKPAPSSTTTTNTTDPTSPPNAPVVTLPGAPQPATPAPAPTTPNTDPTCPAGKKLCGTMCVDPADPAYGCGTCTPCATPHATAACVAGACKVGTCDTHFADCNTNAADGCETDLTLATNCGVCGGACPAASPFCVAAADGLTQACTAACPESAPLQCGNECAAPLTSTNHCGSCGVKCPDVANAEAECKTGLCGFKCKTGFHACGAACANDTDVTQCGAACTACAPGANAVPACTQGACGLVCNQGFGDCNANAADGCEANLTTDAANCGACGAGCDGGTCTNGVCSAPPPPENDGGP